MNKYICGLINRPYATTSLPLEILSTFLYASPTPLLDLVFTFNLNFFLSFYLVVFCVILLFSRQIHQLQSFS